MARIGERSRRDTVFLVLLAVVVVTLFAVLASLHTALYGTALPVAMILAVALCGAPLIALARPRVSIGLFSSAAFLLPLVVSPDGIWPWPWSVPALITFVVFVAVVTFLHGWRLGLIPLLVGIAGSSAAPLLLPRVAAANDSTANLIVAASIGAAACLVATLLAGRIRDGEQLSKERDFSANEQARRVLVEERARIARELHDVVAHTLSVIQVQASSARYRLPGVTEDAAAEFDSIATTARGSLAEMRRLLGVLRTDDQPAELTPQQTIADIPALVDSIRRTGVEVALELIAVTPAVPASVQIAAFRIVQEALSNAVRHAPGAAVSVHVRTEQGAAHLRVHNGAADSPVTPGMGHGLRGMRERVALLHGTFEAGPDAEGGWTVVAVLQWESDAHVEDA